MESSDDVTIGGDLSETLAADSLLGRKMAEADGEATGTYVGTVADEAKDSLERPERGLLVNELKFTRTVVGKICDSKIIGDPHFTGADGSHFDFSGALKNRPFCLLDNEIDRWNQMVPNVVIGQAVSHVVHNLHPSNCCTGVPNKTYALLSDRQIQINAFFGGRWQQWNSHYDPSAPPTRKALTWMRSIAVLWGRHTIVLHARTGSDAEYNNGYLAGIEVDGEEMDGPMAGDSFDLFDGDAEVSWVAARSSGEEAADGEGSGSGSRPVDADVYEVRIRDILQLRLTLQPEVPMMRTASDAVVHFTVELMSVQLTPQVHGVLGQTYREDFKGRL